MSERPNDTPDTQTDDSSGAPEPVVDEAPEAMPAHESDDVEANGPVSETDEFEADDPGSETDEFEAGESSPEPYAENVEPEAGAPIRPMSPSERKAARSGLAHGQLPIDPSLRIKDRASAVFVLLTVGVFVVILLNALVLGHGGFLAPIPTPVPVPTVTTAPPTVAPTVVPTVSPAPS